MKERPKRRENSYEGVAFTGVEGEFLVIHGVSVELRNRICGGTKGSIHGSIHFVETCGGGLSLLSHGYRRRSEGCWDRSVARRIEE